jgi:hypothetical protein
MRNPPILISILGFFAIMAGFVWLVVGLRAIGFDWFNALGDLPSLESVGIWGWMAAIVGVCWVAAGIGLWSLRPWAWMFANIIAIFALVNAFFLMLTYPGSGAGFVQALMPALILWYLQTKEVKTAFGFDQMQ